MTREGKDDAAITPIVIGSGDGEVPAEHRRFARGAVRRDDGVRDGVRGIEQLELGAEALLWDEPPAPTLGHRLAVRLEALPRLRTRGIRIQAGNHGAVDPTDRLSLLVTRHVLASGPLAAEVFDAWRSDGPRVVRAVRGSLVLRRTIAEPPEPILRLVRCRLVLRTSPLPVPMRFELVPSGPYRSVLHLRVDRTLMPTLAWHRRRPYFAAANATLDRIHRRMAAMLVEQGRWEGEPLHET